MSNFLIAFVVSFGVGLVVTSLGAFRKVIKESLRDDS